MNQGRRELVRYVKSLEAQEDPRKEADFNSLPVGLMVRFTLRRIFQSFLVKLGLRERPKK
jgi:hypothetical protein